MPISVEYKFVYYWIKILTDLGKKKKNQQHFENRHKYCGILPLGSCMLELNLLAASSSYRLLLYHTLQLVQPTKLLWPMTSEELEADEELEGSLFWQRKPKGGAESIFFSGHKGE